jgi:Flp pilus assembly secretin CpaC
MLTTHWKAAVAAAALVAALVAVPAVAEEFIVQYDQAKLVRLPEPAANIIIGNPSIADVTLQSSTLLVITGKTFGVTNLIVLNGEDRIILSERLMVKADEQRVVTLTRGGAASTYNCVPKCEPVIKVGDEQTHYQGVLRAAEQKMKISEGGEVDSSGN